MGKWLRGLLWVAGVLALVALILRALVIKVWTVPDDPVLAASIAPSLGPGDTVLVLTRGTPGFGDLVRCPDPEDAQHFIVGRIAGVEGDLVETEGRALWVNGKGYNADSACQKPKVTIHHPSSGSETDLECDVVSMGGGWHYRSYAASSAKLPRTRTDVGVGMIYLVSDDRTFHDDSRDFGTVPKSSCTERIFFRLWGKGGWGDDQARLTYVR